MTTASASHEKQNSLLTSGETVRSYQHQNQFIVDSPHLPSGWSNGVNPCAGFAGTGHAQTAAKFTLPSNNRFSPSSSPPAIIDDQKSKATPPTTSGFVGGLAAARPADSELPKILNASPSVLAVIKSGPATDANPSSQSSVPPAAPETGNAYAAELPTSVRKTLVAWFGRYGIGKPPPCSIYVSSAQLVYKSPRGTPTSYHYQNGLKLDVRLFRLMQFQRTVQIVDDIIMVASNESLGSFIIGRPRYNGGREGKGFRRWEGINGLDPEGWAKEETIFKTWDPAAASELSRIHLVRSHLPAVNVRHLLSEAAKSGQLVTGRVGSSPADERVSLSLSPDEEEAKRNATEVDEITNEDSSADERDDVDHDPIVSQKAMHTNRNVAEPAASYGLQPDDPKYIRQDLPVDLKLLMEQWIVQRGTKEPLPCALHYANWEKWFMNDKGYAYIFRHVNGDTITPRVFKLGSFLSGYDGKVVIVAEGSSFAPCLIRFRKQLRTSHGIGVLYHVWKGVKAKGDDGFDPETPIVKGAPDAINGILNHLRKCPVPDDIEMLRPRKHGKDTLQYCKTLQKTSKRERANVTYDPTKQPIVDSITYSLPKHCDDLINDWLRAHPEQDYGTLPCATGSPDTFLNQGHMSGTPMSWKYKDGRPLQAQMYNLPLSLRPGRAPLRKRVIVVRGENFGPCIVAHRPGPDETSLKGAAKIWLGVRGNKHGFENGISVYKTYSGDKQPTNGPRVPTPPYKRSRADDSEDDSSSQPLVKRYQPDLDASRHRSAIAPAKLHPEIVAPTRASFVPIATLRPHLLHNLVCLLYAYDKPTPRIRLFDACDTPQKLFAQAMAGELFESSQKAISGSRVLRVRVGKSTSTRILVVEDDEEDFDALLESVASSGWFSEQKDRIEGSGSIEVRAA